LLGGTTLVADIHIHRFGFTNGHRHQVRRPAGGGQGQCIGAHLPKDFRPDTAAVEVKVFESRHQNKPTI
jgi:hypothetical protein